LLVKCQSVFDAKFAKVSPLAFRQVRLLLALMMS
jgi:hypothetical protein